MDQHGIGFEQAEKDVSFFFKLYLKKIVLKWLTTCITCQDLSNEHIAIYVIFLLIF